jgi:Sensors of blue-light using FAD
MPLSNLIYVSSARSGLGSSDLQAILDVSLRNNERLELTGMLLYAGGNFMQVLEGEAEAIGQVFAAIIRDLRHHDLVVLEEGPISARSFADWRMGFRALDAADAQTHSGFAPFFVNGFDAGAIGAQKGLALDLLTSFRETNR